MLKMNKYGQTSKICFSQIKGRRIVFQDFILTPNLTKYDAVNRILTWVQQGKLEIL